MRSKYHGYKKKISTTLRNTLSNIWTSIFKNVNKKIKAYHVKVEIFLKFQNGTEKQANTKKTEAD